MVGVIILASLEALCLIILAVGTICAEVDKHRERKERKQLELDKARLSREAFDTIRYIATTLSVCKTFERMRATIFLMEEDIQNINGVYSYFSKYITSHVKVAQVADVPVGLYFDDIESISSESLRIGYKVG